MNLLSEIKIDVNGEAVKIRPDNRALYLAQRELNKQGLFDLINCIDQMDLETIYCILKHSIDKELTDEEVLSLEIPMADFVQVLSDNIQSLFTGKKQKPSQAKKKSKK